MLFTLRGGVSTKLLEALTPYGDFSDLLQGKIVAGESAGANILCEWFYSPNADKVLQGFGIVPFKLIPHFREEKRHKLDDYAPDLETLFLREYEFRVLDL